MNKVMKYTVSMVIGLFIAGSVFAQTTTTVTNRGQVIINRLLTGVATDVKDGDMYQDFSIYPTRLGQQGKIVRFYDATNALQGKVGGTTYQLLPAVAIPAYTLIRGGYIDCMVAFTKADGSTVTNSIGIASATDIMAARTNAFLSTGIKPIVPTDGAATNSIHLATNSYAYITVSGTGSSNTTGKIMVVLDCEMAP